MHGCCLGVCVDTHSSLDFIPLLCSPHHQRSGIDPCGGIDCGAGSTCVATATGGHKCSCNTGSCTTCPVSGYEYDGSSCEGEWLADAFLCVGVHCVNAAVEPLMEANTFALASFCPISIKTNYLQTQTYQHILMNAFMPPVVQTPSAPTPEEATRAAATPSMQGAVVVGS